MPNITRLSDTFSPTEITASMVTGDYASVGQRVYEVVRLTGAEAANAGWGYTESNGELTITEVPTLTEPTHVRIPDFIDGKPVKHLAAATGEGTMFRIYNVLSATSLMVETVGNHTFYVSFDLTAVDFPRLVSAGDLAFGSVSGGLESVYMPSLVSGGEGMFQYQTFVNISLPSLTTAGVDMFLGCGALENVDLPNLVTAGNRAFGICTGLKELNLPSLTTTGSGVFSRCDLLETVRLPRWESSGDWSFFDSPALKEVYLGPHFKPTGSEHFDVLTGSPPDSVIIFYPPGDTDYGEFWPDETAVAPGASAQRAEPDRNRWVGVINEGETLVRNGNTFVSGTPWL